MNKIARVFARKTSMCPTDQDCYFGLPEMYMPEYNEVRISVTFTWDIERGEYLKNQWKTVCNNIKIGGCAYNDLGGNFQAGMYLKKGITITSRGCSSKCWFCYVPKREGEIRELPVIEGNIIQDNNLLACSSLHIREVFAMLKNQKAICFKGGFESNKISDRIVEDLRGLSIKEIWLACDSNIEIKNLKKAVDKLKKYFNRNKLRCFALIGFDMKKEENRLRQIYEMGCLPFAQLYQPENRIVYSKKWKQFARKWSRPAIYKAFMKNQ